jgi:predicted nucleotidyltransferase
MGVMNIFDKFLTVFKALEEKEVEYILIGGFAVILHGFPRLTQDIDLLIKMTSSNIRKLQKALFQVFHDQDIHNINLADLKKYAVVRYGSPEGFHLDLISKIGQLATYEDVEYEMIPVENISIRTATPESLRDLKKDSLRPEDQRDLIFLEELIKTNKPR